MLRSFPVTNREYLGFLDALVLAGREEEALRFVPQERAGQAGQPGAMIYGRRSDGGFELVPDADGDQWEPDYPVCIVDWHSARAFAGWEQGRTGQAWRLPGELEWEKAARGVDGRFFPWGDGFDPSRCCMRDSHPGGVQPSVVESYPLDESVYGVRGMAGNMMDWCVDEYTKEGPPTLGARLVTPLQHEQKRTTEGAFRVNRGGSWSNYPRNARLANRYGFSPGFRFSNLGFRITRAAP